MKFIKRQPIDRNSPMRSQFAVESDGRIITDSTNSLELPTGTNAQRPATPVNGQLRYNTQLGTGDIEAYVNGTWQRILTNRQATITQTTFTNGDYANTIFGPLPYDVSVSTPQNVVVVVDNVYQIGGTDYTLVKSTPSNILTTSTTIIRNEPANTTTLYVSEIADFNIGATLSGTGVNGSEVVGYSITASTLTISPGSISPISSGTVITTSFGTGTYVVFTPGSYPVPSVPVVTIQGFDGYGAPFES
jgi:hypothetical protein